MSDHHDNPQGQGYAPRGGNPGYGYADPGAYHQDGPGGAAAGGYGPGPYGPQAAQGAPGQGRHHHGHWHHAMGYGQPPQGLPHGAPPAYPPYPAYGPPPGYPAYGAGYGPAPYPAHPPAYHGFGPGLGGSGSAPPGYGAANPGSVPPAGFIQGLAAHLPAQNTEQFLLGLLIGAGATWVLSDEDLRGKLIKSALKLYSSIAGGFEEMKEQMADIKAEMDTEEHGEG